MILHSAPALKCRQKENFQRYELERTGRAEILSYGMRRRATASAYPAPISPPKNTPYVNGRHTTDEVVARAHVEERLQGTHQGCRILLPVALSFLSSVHLHKYLLPPFKGLSPYFHKHVTVLQDLTQVFVSIQPYSPTGSYSSHIVTPYSNSF